MVRNSDETLSPKYKAQAVTAKVLRLFGKVGLKNGFEIMDKICKTLLEGQKDIAITRIGVFFWLLDLISFSNCSTSGFIIFYKNNNYIILCLK